MRSRWSPACKAQAGRDSHRPCRKGVTTQVFYDRGNLVERAVGTVSKALIEAIVLVVVLLLLFLGNLRAALVVALDPAAVGAGHLHPDAAVRHVAPT